MDRVRKKVAGFSLLELMVVVAIIGVLAAVAVPRFNIFRARARQAEAKANLGQIFTLQESFSIEHEFFYNGDNTQWGGAAMNTDATAYGYNGTVGCPTTTAQNKLGFRLANCAKARYRYWIAGATETGYLAVAHGASDVAGDKRVYPGCQGNSPATSRDASMNLAGVAGGICANSAGVTSAQLTATAYTTGDAWCQDEDRDLFNYRDITEFCNE